MNEEQKHKLELTAFLFGLSQSAVIRALIDALPDESEFLPAKKFKTHKAATPQELLERAQ